MSEEPKIHLLMGEEDGESHIPEERRAAITAFRVFARLRPFIAEELEILKGQDLRSTIEMKGDSTFPLNPANNWRPSHEFVFDKSLWSIPQSQKLKPTPHFYDNKHEECINQEDMYNIATRDETGTSMIDNAFMGINSCVLTYGQTSSGKTHTMMGQYGEGCDPAMRGIIPRVCDELFTKVQERREFEAAKEDESKRWELDVSVTFVEIYLEKVRDLLDKKLRTKQAVRATTGGGREESAVKEALAAMKEARIRRDPEKGPYVEGIEHVKVNSWQDCEKVLQRGSAHRTTAVTSVHDNSSRSHAIFTVSLVQKRLLKEDRVNGKVYERKSGCINLVDLAGSERGGGTTYVNESAAINKSLTSLRRVIDKLMERQTVLFERHAAQLEGRPVPGGALPHVPYMDSVLTQLLEDSIGGNSKTVMISNMTPYSAYYEETLRTLEWSQKARKLVTVVVNNIDESGMVKDALSGQIGNIRGKADAMKMNVSNLNDELNKRDKRIAHLKEKNAETQERIDALSEKYGLSMEAHAARVVQLMMYLNAFRKMRARKRREVAEAESATSNARREVRELEEKHEALVDSLLRHNIIMRRIKEKAEAMNQNAEDDVNAAASNKQRQPEDLREELVQKKQDIKDKGTKLSLLEKEKDATAALLEKYEQDRERNEIRRENERLEAEEYAANYKNEVLQDVLQNGYVQSDKDFLTHGIDIDGENVSLFEQAADGKWQPSSELQDLLRTTQDKKRATQDSLVNAQKEKKEAEDKKSQLEAAVEAEKSKAHGLETEIAKLNQLIKEANDKCC